MKKTHKKFQVVVDEDWMPTDGVGPCVTEGTVMFRGSFTACKANMAYQLDMYGLVCVVRRT